MNFQFISKLRISLVKSVYCIILSIFFSICSTHELHTQVTNHGCDHNSWCPSGTSWSTVTKTVPIPGYPFCFAKVEYDIANCDTYINVVKLKSIQYIGLCNNLLSLIYPLGLNGPPDEIFLRQLYGQVQKNLLALVFEETFNNTTDPVQKDLMYCTDENGNPRNSLSYPVQALMSGACMSLCTAVLQDVNTLEYVVAHMYQDCFAVNCCIMYYNYCIDRNTNKAVRVPKTTLNTGVYESQCLNGVPPDCPSFVTSNYNIISTYSGTCKYTCPEED